MLRLRICPNCQEETYSKKAYFCYHCGAELPPPPEVEKIAQAVVETGHASSLPKEGGSGRRLKIVAAALAAALLLTIGGSVYYFQIKPSQPSLPSPPKNETFVAEVSFEVANHPFSAKGLSEVVPADVDLYLESLDPEILLPAIVPPHNWAQVGEVLLGKAGLTVGDSASFLEDEFALIQEASASAFLVRVRDVDFLERKLAEVGTVDGWEAKVSEGVLVVSDSPSLIKSIEEAQRKLILNLSLTSGFAEARRQLPKTGQVFYYGKKRLGFIPKEIKGEAFVISKKDSGALVTGL